MAKLHRVQAALDEVIKGRIVGHWSLTEPFGRGGQGTTWRAIWKDQNHPLTRVAVVGGSLNRGVIKVMLPPDPDEWGVPAPVFPKFLENQVELFMEECEVLANIESPYIPEFYQVNRQKTAAGIEGR